MKETWLRDIETHPVPFYKYISQISSSFHAQRKLVDSGISEENAKNYVDKLEVHSLILSFASDLGSRS